MKLLSIVVPCYNEEASVPLFYEEVTRVLKELSEDMTYELVFVNDGSADKTLSALKELAAKDPRVIYLSFSRNLIFSFISFKNSFIFSSFFIIFCLVCLI